MKFIAMTCSIIFKCLDMVVTLIYLGMRVTMPLWIVSLLVVIAIGMF